MKLRQAALFVTSDANQTNSLVLLITNNSDNIGTGFFNIIIIG